MLLLLFFQLAHAAPLTAFATTKVGMDQIIHPLQPTTRWDSSLLSKPKPTGAWWENAVLRAGEQTIATLVQTTGRKNEIFHVSPIMSNCGTMGWSLATRGII